MMLRVLLTGFEPFGIFPYNPSQQLVQTFTTELAVEVETLVLPVDFKEVTDFYQLLLGNYQPHLILNLGLAATNKGFGLEAIALNLKAEKHELPYLPIANHKEAALFSTLPIDAIAQHLCKNTIPAIRSNHAGTYLCNFIYYQSLAWCKQHGGDALFIHLPFTTEMASSICLDYKKTYPSLSLDTMKKGIETIIQFYLLNKNITPKQAMT